MASIYTDKAREARYDKLRIKKNRYEKILGICMLLSLFIGIATFISGIFFGLLSGAFLGDISVLVISFLATACNAFAIYAIYAKNWKITIAAIAIAIAMVPFGMNDIVLVLALIPALIVHVLWKKLSQEEGFPLFQITQDEYDKRRQALERQTKKHALEEGVRVASTEQTSEMGDLLDDGFDSPVMPGELHAYHDRSRNANTVETAPSRQTGNMDSLEDI